MIQRREGIERYWRGSSPGGYQESLRGVRELWEIHRDKEKGYLNSFSLNRQMALLQANKDLISAGMKEFNVLLNQQVSLGTLFQMAGLLC